MSLAASSLAAELEPGNKIDDDSCKMEKSSVKSKNSTRPRKHPRRRLGNRRRFTCSSHSKRQPNTVYERLRRLPQPPILAVKRVCRSG